MGKKCGSCGLTLPKQLYGDGKAKGRKKKGKNSGKCNGCVKAGGNCVALSAAGFELVGISSDLSMSFLNGIYSKMDKKEGGRHVYNKYTVGAKNGHMALAIWYSPDGFWNIGEMIDIETVLQFASIKSLAASPEQITVEDSVWKMSEAFENKNDFGMVPMSGITTTALNCEALAATKLAADHAFHNATEQAAPSVVLSGLDSNHELAFTMGEYKRQDEREKVNGSFVYKGPKQSGLWAYSSEGGRGWSIGRETDIGTGISCMFVLSAAPVPESIQTKFWQLHGADDTARVLSIQVTSTAIHHKPAQLFQGTCELCVHCREWRRCGRCSSGAMYCSAECQRAHCALAGRAQ
jgi:hypothetical protein